MVTKCQVSNWLVTTEIMPEYARETLIKMPVRIKGAEVSLTDICVKYNISKGKFHWIKLKLSGKIKESYVTIILQRVEHVYKNRGELEQVQRYVKNEYHTGAAPLHELYVSRFNAVDLGDRYYAKVNDGHRIHDWHSKMLYAILKLGMVNAYIYQSQHEYHDWIDFRRNLAIQLLRGD